MKAERLASRLSYQLSQYVTWKLDPSSIEADASRSTWNLRLNHVFPKT